MGDGTVSDCGSDVSECECPDAHDGWKRSVSASGDRLDAHDGWKRSVSASGDRPGYAPPMNAPAETTILALDGSEMPLSSLYADGPAAVVWLRHYG